MKPRVQKPDCGHRPVPRVSRRRYDSALSAAEALCVAAGEPWSDVRRRTYDLLLKAQKPAGAYDLLRRFAPGGRPPGPPVIYRALGSLMRAGLVHRVVSADKFVVCAKPGSHHTASFLICECCGRADELIDRNPGPHPDGRAGFRVRSILLEMRGLCRNCRE